MKFELCEYRPIRQFGYGWEPTGEEFDTEEEANKAKEAKANPINFRVRPKRELSKVSAPGIIFNKRREQFNSTDPKEFRKIM
jgi:hypothetical protein